MGDAAPAVARTASSAKLCDSPREHAQQAAASQQAATATAAATAAAERATAERVAVRFSLLNRQISTGCH